MSYLEGSNQDVTRRKDVISGSSFLSDDSSCPEDLLARLYDFPHVPGDVSHHVEMFPLAVHQAEDHTSAKRSSSVASLLIDTTLEAEHDALPSGEGDPTSACLRASQILRAHPGLVMEHYDPTTSVHTFKIAYRRSQQDEDPLLPSPATPSLSNSSSDSSPLTPYMQTPPSASLRRFRSVSSSSRDPFDSRITAGGLHRVAHSTSSSASDSSDSVLRHHPPLRRTASELSERSPAVGSRYHPPQSRQVIPPSIFPLSSHLSSSTHSSTAERLACVTGVSPGPGDAPPPPSPGYSCISNDSRSCSDTFMSSNELLAFREFLARRREDVLTEARNLGTSVKMDRHPYRLGGLREDAVGDCSEREESITSGRHLGVHQPDKNGNVAGHHACNPPCSNTTSVSTVLGFLDGTSTKEDLLRALSIIRAERAQVSSDDGSLLAGSDTFFDLCARSSSPAPKRQLESPSYGYLQVPHSQQGVSPRSQLTDLPSPAATYATSVEEIQDFLPDFLDLHSDGDPLGANEMLSSGSGSLRLLVQDERLAPVPEGSAAYPSQERKPMGVENDQPDPELANLLPGTHFGAQTKQSAAELVSGYSRPAHPFVSSQSYSRSPSAHGDFQHINSYDRRGNHQASPVSATVTVTAEETGGSYHHRVYDNGKGPLAEYAELAYRQSVVESDGPRSDGSYYAKRVRDDRAGVSRHGKPGLPMAVRSSSPRDFQSREVGRVVQRPRAMTVQEASVSVSATSNRLHRSASATASTSSTSSSSRRRYRTLSDRAYRHPDVPHSPLFSDLDHPPLPQGGYYAVPTPRGAFSSHHMDYRRVSPSETSSTPLLPSRSPYPGEVSSRNTSPRPPRSRPQMPHGHGRNGSHPVRPHQPAQAQVRRTGSTPDLRRGASTPTIQSSTQGVGLSLIDNGAFEAPRPAPEPRTHAENKPGLPSRTARRGPPAALKIPAEDDETPASYLVIADSPPAFSAFSFRRHVRSKKQKQPPRSDSPGGGHLRPAGSSESDLNSSFFSILDSDVKPQRKGLFFKKKT